METAVEPQTAPTLQSSDPSQSPQAPGAPAAASPTSPSSTSPVGDRPDWLPESYWDAEKGLKADDWKAHLATLQTEAEQAKARMAGVPEKADAYELKLPEGEKMPDGFQLNPDDPRVAMAREFAHANKLTQAEFQGLVALDTKIKQAETDWVRQQSAEAFKRLGPNGQARVEAVKASIEARVGKELAPHLVAMLVTDNQVVAFEQAFGSTTQFNAGGRAGESAQKGAIPGFDKMGFRQRMAALDAAKQAAVR